MTSAHTVPEPVDYPPYCAACARHVVGGLADLGIVIGGSGQGEQIAANKVHGARAALCHDEYTARLARQHNDANVLHWGHASWRPSWRSTSSTSSWPPPSRADVTRCASMSCA